MQYSPHRLRIWISNAESSLRWLSQKRPQNMSPLETKAVELNILRINKFQKLLDASKSFTPRYL
jgi:hypothetical protein